MRPLMWGFLGILGLMWSGVAWLLHGVAGAGGAAVVAVTRWLELEPASTQWIADTLSLAGGLAQGLVIAIWLLGIAVLAVIGWAGSRAVANAEETARQMADARRGYGAGDVLEGEVRQKTVSRPGQIPPDA